MEVVPDLDEKKKSGENGASKAIETELNSPHDITSKYYISSEVKKVNIWLLM